MFYIEIIYNLSLLVTLSLLSAFIWNAQKLSYVSKSVFQGFIFGIIAIVGMMYPLEFAEGVIFDGRSVIISLCGLFFGPISVAISSLMAVAFRIYQGGVGVFPGSMVVIVSGLTGVFFYFRYYKKYNFIKLKHLIILGFVVHVAMLLLMLTFPREIAQNIVKKMGLYILTVYPLATIIIGQIIFESIERLRYNQILKASEERYRTFFSQVSDGVLRFEFDKPMIISLPIDEQVDFIYDHARIAECNDACLKMYGLTSAEEIIGKGQIDFHGGRNNPVNRGVLLSFVRNNYRTENVITEEINTKGQKVFFNNNSIGIIENNKLIRIWGTQTDITEKVKSDNLQEVLFRISNAAVSSITLLEFLEIIREQLGHLLDATNFYIAFYDENTDMLSTHYDVDQKDEIETWPAKKSVTGLVIKNQQSLLVTEADIMQLYKSGEIELIGTPSKIWLGVPLMINKKVNGAIVVQSYDDPFAYNEKDKQMLEFIASQISISIERKKAEEELIVALAKAQEADRLKTAFLANMSHEIRTPMNGILGFTELLADSHFTGEEKRDFINIIRKSGQRMLNTVNDLIDISKIETGQMQVVLTETNLREQVLNLYNFFKPEASEKLLDFRLSENINPAVALVRTDVPKLDSIMTNLIKNALKYTDSGFVEIRVSLTGNVFTFSVSDSGIGIPEERKHAIFNRFEQADIEDSRALQGSGLGLAITRAYVVMLGGTIKLESEVGKGSEFTVTIPVEGISGQKVSDATTVNNDAQPSKPHLKILIAEDDPVGDQYLTILLSELKADVLHAINGQDAVEICRENTDIDIVMMDIRMPVMDGYEATRQIRAFNREVVIIAQTAFALSGDREKALQAGCNDYISKPIKKDELIQIILKYI